MAVIAMSVSGAPVHLKIGRRELKERPYKGLPGVNHEYGLLITSFLKSVIRNRCAIRQQFTGTINVSDKILR